MSGSVRRGRQALRISVQLWDAESSANLWAFSAEVPVEKIFDTQDEIVIKIVGGIAPHVRLAELQAALRKRPASFTAYDHLLRALSLMNRLEVGSFMEARSFLERATTADPRFAAALAWTARWYSVLAGQGWSSEPDEDRERGAAFAAQAIEIDPDNSLALAVYGHLKSFLFHDYESAQVYLARALMASPSNSLAWILSSATLSYIGRSEEAIRHAEHALRLSPFDPALFSYYMFLGIAHYAHGNYDEAVKWGRMSISENPRYTSTLKLLAASLSAQGRILEARTAGEQLLSFEPGFRLATYAARQPFRDPHVKASYLGHLLAAGLPE